MLSRRSLLGASAGLMSLGILNPALARTPYPQRLIRIVVGNAAGGTDDAISRSVAHEIAGQFGQSVIVENRGGGSTTIAGSTVASAAPDGYTILCLISAGIVQTVLRDKLKYGLSSFAPIVGVGGFPLALAVSATSKARLNSIHGTANSRQQCLSGNGRYPHGRRLSRQRGQLCAQADGRRCGDRAGHSVPDQQ